MPRRRHDPASLVSDVGRRIGELRAERKLTQAELAERMACSTRYIAQVEGGQNLTIETLAKLASLLDVEVTSFFAKPASSAPRQRGRPKKASEIVARDVDAAKRTAKK